MNTNSDKQLVELAKQDLENFNSLYEKYRIVIFRYCYSRVSRNKHLAEDITSETFVKAIENFDSYEPRDNKPFVVWIYTIAHNLIVDHFRKKRNKNVSLDELPIKPSDEKENILVQLSKEELREMIDQKREELPDELNNIFTLHFTEELTFKEISKLIGKSEGAVKMQYYRGLDYLKSLVVPE